MTTTRRRQYHPHWPHISKRARQLAHGGCVWCLWRRSKHVHHVRYKDMLGQLIAGRERPGWDVFPVCHKCHGELHTSDLYEEYPDPNNNGNDIRTIARLILMWRIRRLPLEWMAVVAVAGLVVWVRWGEGVMEVINEMGLIR
jgi:hypothetical protein